MQALLWLSVVLIVASGVGFAATSAAVFLQTAAASVLMVGMLLFGLGMLSVAIGCMFGLAFLAILLLLRGTGTDVSFTFRWRP